ncbi:MAG TPA: hypothetical protein VNI83_05960 [Vicinamibacterales bacterium]|nr:hypothetical protein [Vicinamibacterales bacterium]
MLISMHEAPALGRAPERARRRSKTSATMAPAGGCRECARLRRRIRLLQRQLAELRTDLEHLRGSTEIWISLYERHLERGNALSAALARCTCQPRTTV